MTKLTMVQIGQALATAGWTTDLIPTAISIVMAESGGLVEAIGGPNPNGTYDYGLLQINSIHNYSTSLLLSDAVYNCRAGYAIWTDRQRVSGNGFTAWATYTSATYLKYMDAATTAASGIEPATSTHPFPPRLSAAERLAIYGDPYNPTYPVVDYLTPWGFTIKLNSTIVNVYDAAARYAYYQVDWKPVQIQTLNIRPIRGETDWSLHSWALAGDHFAQWDPDNVWNPTNGVPRDFANAFIRYGFTWGGTWDRIDVPHIEWGGAPPTGVVEDPGWIDVVQNPVTGRCSFSRWPDEIPREGTMTSAHVRRPGGGSAVVAPDDELWGLTGDSQIFEWTGPEDAPAPQGIY